jgi:UDPglucose 6-dehydrogenase
MNKITIVGSGYVGMSLAALLCQNNQVIAFDINKERVNLINNNKSTIADNDIEDFLIQNTDNISATCDASVAFKEPDYVFIATPTNYDEHLKFFDTSSVEKVIKQSVENGYKGPVIIKSTVPIGFTKKINQYFENNIIFSPEFLREGSALKDNLYPSRIIIGSECGDAHLIAKLLTEASAVSEVSVLFMKSSEAEAVKLFANTYLAMRVSFFNEIDSFALVNNLDCESIINGVSLDHRVGNFYNNPSFGYGGYCLPKDTKQLLSNFEDVPQNLISSIVESNKTRKIFIADEIIKLKPKVVGVYKLSMKHGSDNYRFSSVLDVINNLSSRGVEVLIYEPAISNDNLDAIPLLNDLSEFKARCDVIICNRVSSSLDDVKDKIFSRDIFNAN